MHYSPDDISPDDIKRLMHERLPAGVQTLIELVGAAADRQGVSVYLVGGFVRDLLLNRPNVDLDFVVEGDAVQLVNALVAQHGGGSFFGAAQFFGTAKWTLSREMIQSLGLRPTGDEGSKDTGIAIDFARARRETYAHPGALPMVDPTPVTIEDDLQRRDFSINALAIRIPGGDLIDRFRGINDLLQTRTIRVLHEQSFIDDPTRIFRAVRFEQRFGFSIEPHTESLIALAPPLINNLSGERIRHEFDMIFQEAAPEKALVRLSEPGILRQIDPELHFGSEAFAAFQKARSADSPLELWAARRLINRYIYWPIWACFIDPPIWERLQARLPFDHDMTAIIEQTFRAVRLVRSNPGQVKPSEFAKKIEPFDRVQAKYAARAVLSLESHDPLFEAYLVRRMDTIQPGLTGNDLIGMGLQPGPSFGTILRKLRDARLDGEISTVEEERALVHQWLEQGLLRE